MATLATNQSDGPKLMALKDKMATLTTNQNLAASKDKAASFLRKKRQEFRELVRYPRIVNLNDALLHPQNIRLLKLYRARHEQKVKFHVIETPISDGPDYYALSYTWGDPSVTATVTCRHNVECGIGPWQDIQVTRNLERALAGICDSNGYEAEIEGVHVWADGLCINQTDNEEKKSQLALIPDIYRNAIRVIVFLSETFDAKRVKEALDHIVELECVERTIHEGFYDKRDVPSSKHQGETAYSGFIKHPDMLMMAQCELTLPYYVGVEGFHLGKRFITDITTDKARAKAPPPDRDHRITQEDLVRFGIPGVDYTLLDEILRSTWFGRSWINQEIANAYNADFYIGKYRMRWDAMRRLAIVLTDLNAENPSACIQFAAGFLRVAKIKNTLANGKMTPLQAVTLCRPCGASNPRDKIYSLLSMMEGGSQVPVDYTLPWQAVYEDFARQMISREDMAILSCCDYKRDRHPELPSWVADWTDQKFARQLLPSSHRASGNIQAGATFPSQGVLRTKAILLDRILACEAALPPPIRYASMEEYSRRSQEELERQAATAFFSASKRITAQASDYKVYPEPKAAFLRTLVGGRQIDPHLASLWYAARGSGLLGSPPSHQANSSIQEYDRLARRNCADSRFFSTAQGYIGTGPMALQSGDVIAVLHGANVPFVLRERDDGCYSLLGFCYVEGIMQGEAMELGEEVELRIK